MTNEGVAYWLKQEGIPPKMNLKDGADSSKRTDRERTRSPDRRGRYDDDSRSPSRDRYRSRRRERSPANGHYNGRDSRGPARSYQDRQDEKPTMAQSVGRNSKQENRVYVGNLPYDVKWHSLKDFMKEGMFPSPSSHLTTISS